MRPGLVFAALLALAAVASAKKYTSREEYAKENEFEVRTLRRGRGGAPVDSRAASQHSGNLN